MDVMTVRLYVYSIPENLRYTLVRGVSLRDWLRDNGIPAMWSPLRKGWQVRTDRIGDLIARAELDGFEVRMKGAVR